MPSQSMAFSLEQILGSSNSHTSSDAEKGPRADDLDKAWPEAIFLSAVFLEVEVLIGVFLRVALLLIFFVLPAVYQ